MAFALALAACSPTCPDDTCPAMVPLEVDFTPPLFVGTDLTIAATSDGRTSQCRFTGNPSMMICDGPTPTVQIVAGYMQYIIYPAAPASASLAIVRDNVDIFDGALSLAAGSYPLAGCGPECPKSVAKVTIPAAGGPRSP